MCNCYYDRFLNSKFSNLFLLLAVIQKQNFLKSNISDGFSENFETHAGYIYFKKNIYT